MDHRTVKVGTRTSALAMAQTDEVVGTLRSAFPDTRFQIVPITSDGDRNKNAPLLSLGRGTFAKRLEQALLDGDIDMAVHSSKDLASILPDGLAITAYPERKDPRDVIVNRWGLRFTDLPSGATLGTSSPRRCGQLLSVRPDIEFVPTRGNVDTRLSKVGADGCDGVVLAAAGLERLGRLDEATEILTPDLCVPDAGQGALAVETRAGDERITQMLAVVNHSETWAAVTAERAFVQTAGGGCRVPVAAYAIVEDGELMIRTMACLPDGSKIFRKSITASADDPQLAGSAAAEALMQTGADSIMYRDGAS